MEHIKYLSCYLPYAIRVSNGVSTEQIISIDYASKQVTTLFRGHLENVYPIDEIINDIVLRPMSDLVTVSDINIGTNPLIYEIAKQIAKLQSTPSKYGGCTYIRKDDSYVVRILCGDNFNITHEVCIPTNIKVMPLHIADLFLEYHFDIFGLINKGLAININKI